MRQLTTYTSAQLYHDFDKVWGNRPIKTDRKQYKFDLHVDGNFAQIIVKGGHTNKQKIFDRMYTQIQDVFSENKSVSISSMVGLL
ncbi:hypothetical protein [Butyrivibrio sp.]|uniref:hypothetical protein n=1 Tax=Butyrivibrio sp. TaxID=28121 RepID=UPI0025C53F56|nr:hypothetical protein [Butyrivibrio sp.]MBQ9302320.1 hypothetical protein [Butyrivibrio sp.]